MKESRREMHSCIPVHYYISATLSLWICEVSKISFSCLSISPCLSSNRSQRSRLSKFTVKFIEDKRGNVLPVEKSPPLQLLLIHVEEWAPCFHDIIRNRFNFLAPLRDVCKGLVLAVLAARNSGCATSRLLSLITIPPSFAARLLHTYYIHLLHCRFARPVTGIWIFI